MAAIPAGISVLVLMRFGVVAMMSMLLFSMPLEELPQTLLPSDFYSLQSASTLLVLVSVILYGFRSALRGRSVVAENLLDSENRVVRRHEGFPLRRHSARTERFHRVGVARSA